MSDVFQLKQHDLEPPLTITVTDGAATFDQVSSWKVLVKVGSTVYTDSAPTVVLSNSNKTAAVTHDWVSGETDVATTSGRAEVEATWPNGRKQTFPPNGYKTVVIDADLG